MKNFYARIFFAISFILAGFSALAQPVFEINNVKDPCDGLMNGSFEVLVNSATAENVFLDVYGVRDGAAIVRQEIPANIPFLVDRMRHGNIVVVVSNGNGEASTDFVPLIARSSPIIDNVVLEKNSCTGAGDGSIELTVSGGSGNFLFSLDGGQSFVPNPIVDLAGGSYTVTIFDEGTNCFEEVEVEIEDELSMSVNAPEAFCGDSEPVNLEDYINPSVTGGSFTFVGEGVSGSIFDPAAVALDGNSNTVVIEVTYEVNACVVEAEISIDINKEPQAPSLVREIALLCQDEEAASIELSGEDGATIRVYKDAELTQLLSTGATFNPASDDAAFSTASANTFTYYATQELNDCYSEALSFSIEVLAKPDAGFASDNITEICEGESAAITVNFTGQEDFTLTYTINGEERTATVNTTSYPLELGKPEEDVTVELISLTDGTNCAVTNLGKTARVKVNPRPVAEINSFDPVCLEDPEFELTNGSPSGGVYAGPGVSLRSGVYYFSPLSAGADTHTITYTISNPTTGCDSTAEASIVVNALPEVSFAAFTEAVCVNAEEPITLTGGSPAGGVYSGTAVYEEGGVYKFNPATAGVGTYTITYTYADANSCENVAEQAITVSPAEAPRNLSIATSNDGEDLCADDEVRLTASAENAGEEAVYRWFLNSGTEPVQEGTENFYDFTPANGDVIKVTLTQGTLACGTGETIEEQTAAFRVNALPVITVMPEDVTICAEGDATLDFEFSGVAPFTITYSASTATGQSSITVNENTLQLIVSPVETTTYTFTSIEDANCSQALVDQSVKVTVNPALSPAVSISPEVAEICAGNEVSFTATPVNGGEGAEYEWYVNGVLIENHNEATYSFTPAHNDQVYVRLIQGTLACGSGTSANSNTVTIDAESTPDASFSGPEEFCLSEESVQYEPTVAGGTFTASLNGEEVAVISADGTFTPTQAGEYTIIYSVTSERGCENESAPLTVTVNEVQALAIKLSRDQTSDAVCPEDNAFTYTVNITNGGQDPQIQWFINDELQAGESGTELLVRDLAAGTQIVSVSVTQGATNEALICRNSATETDSDEITIRETATAVLAEASETICAGDEIALRFTLTGTAPFSFSYSEISAGVETIFVVEDQMESEVVIELTPSADATYQLVSFSDANACATEMSGLVSVKVNPALAPEILSINSNVESDLCAEEEVTLTASADNAGEGAIYSWFRNSEETPLKTGEENTLTFAPDNGDVIRLELSQGTLACGTGGTDSEQTAAFSVNDRPAITVMPEDVTICAETDAILNFEFSGLAPFKLTYTASTAEGETTIEVNENTLQLGMSPDETTTYTFTSIEDANCSQTLIDHAVTVTVNDQLGPDVSLSASATEICAETGVLFTANPTNAGEGAVYQWYVNGELVEDHSETTYSYTPAHEDQVSVQLIQGTLACETGTTATSNVLTMDVEAAPDASFNGPAEFCLSEQSVQYEPTVAGGTFTASLNGEEVAEITADGTFTPTEAGEYTIVYSVSTERGCENESEPFTVRVNKVQSLAIILEKEQTSDAVCAEDNSFTYTVDITNGGQNPDIRWFVNDELQEGETETEFVVNNLAAGTHVVSVSVQQGAANEELVCRNNATETETDEIIIGETATAELAEASESICEGDEIALRFTLTGTAPFSFSYSEISAGVETIFTIEDQMESEVMVELSPSADATYQLVSFTDANGCATEVSGQVEVTIGGAVPAAPVAEQTSFTVCEGEETFPAFAATGSNLVWYQSIEGELLEVGTGETYTPEVTEAGSYTYLLTQQNDCGTSEATTISFIISNEGECEEPVCDETPATPEVSTTSEVICKGEDNPVFTAGGINLKWYLNVEGGQDVLLAENVERYTPEVEDAGSYNYYVTQENDCGESEAATISFTIRSTTACETDPGCTELPAAPVLEETAYAICINDEYPVFQAEGTNLKWSLVTEEGNIVVGTGENYTPEVAEAGSYVYEVTQENACGESEAVEISFIIRTAEECNTDPGCDEIPAAPIVSTTSFSYCIDSEDEIPTFLAEGAELKWYLRTEDGLVAVGTGETYIPEVEEAGSYTYLVTQSNNCGESEAVEISYLVRTAEECATDPGCDELPAAPEVAENTFIVCAEDEYPVFTAVGTNLKWYLVSEEADVLVAENIDSYTPEVEEAGIYTYYVTQENDCGVSEATTISFTIRSAAVCETDPDCTEVPAAPVASSPDPICEGEANPALTAEGTNLRWYSAAEEGAELQLLSEEESFTSPETTAGSYTYFVTQSNACGESETTEIVLVIRTTEECGTDPGCDELPAAPVATTSSEEPVCEGTAPEEYPVFTAEGENLKWYLVIDEEPVQVGVGEQYIPEVTPAGTYTYLVTQENECGISEESRIAFVISNEGDCGNVEPPLCENAPLVDLGEDNARCAGGEITLDAGYEPGAGYSVEWTRNGEVYEGGQTITVGTSGTYAVTVTDLATNCSATDEIEVTIEESITASVTIRPISEMDCEGGPVVLEALLVNGGANPVYTWLKDGEPLEETGNVLELTEYEIGERITVIVNVDLACAEENPIRDFFFISTPEPQAPSVSPMALTICEGDNNPAFSANGTNLKWYAGSVAEANMVATGDSFIPAETAAGSYTYLVTQENSCGVSEATAVSFTIRTTDECAGDGFDCGFFSAMLEREKEPSCDRQNGEMHYTISGGQAPYFVRYSFAGDLREQVKNSETFSLEILNIPADDTVRLYVRDAYGRECTLKNVLEMAPRITASLTKSEDGDISCFGEQAGKARLEIVGGNAPFQYLLNDAEGWVTLNGRTKDFTELPAGINSILVRDSEGDECFGSAEVEIRSLNPQLNLVYDSESANCNDNTGKIWVRQISGGNGGPYKLKLQSEAAFRDFEGEMAFEELARGPYTVIVTDGVCEIQQEVRIGSPGLIAIEEPEVIPYDCDEPGLKARLFVRIADYTEVPGPYEATISQKNESGDFVLVPGMDALRFNSQDELYQEGFEKGTYRIEVRTVSRDGCPENYNRDIVIDNPEMPTPITFTQEAVNIYCADSKGGVQITRLKGERNLPYTISVYAEDQLVKEKVISREEYLVNNGSEGVFEVSELSAGIYRLMVSQDQGLCDRIETSEAIAFRVEENDRKLFAEVTAKTESFPERGTGNLTLTVSTNSGQEPYISSIYLVDPLFPGQYYESESDEVVYDPIESTFKLTYTDMPAGKYEIYVTDANGCSILLEETIEYDQRLFIPNVITPNGDGYNEYFYVRNIPASGTRLIITNRWGKVVYATDNYANNWDGGDEPDGVYFYHLLVVDGENINMKGYVEIKRGGRP